MTDPAPPPIRRRQLAIRLLELRKATGLNQDEVVKLSGLSRSTISKIENAEQSIREKNVRLLAHAYGVGAPELDMLLRMTAEAKQRGVYLAHSDVAPDFAKDYFELEAYARTIWFFESMHVPGLFQVPDYIRALTLARHPDASEEALQQSVNLRTARQARLVGDDPPSMQVIIDEGVLHRPVGGNAVMVEQISHLIEVSKLPTITLQLLPLSVGAHPAMVSPFIILRFDDTSGMDVVYVENLVSATYHEKPSDLVEYMTVFEQVKKLALSPRASRVLMDTLRAALGAT